MHVKANHVISVHYELRDDEGELLESSRDNQATEKSQPMIYLHGHRQMIRGFERGIKDCSVDDKCSFTVMPAEGYGLRNVNNIQRVPAKYLKHEGKLVPGKVIRVNTDNGVKTGTVLKVGKFNIDVDLNHPFAGKNLHCDVEIIDIRKATEEEIAHGHVHGEHGCNH